MIRTAMCLALGLPFIQQAGAQISEDAWKPLPDNMKSVLETNWARIDDESSEIDFSALSTKCKKLTYDGEAAASSDLWGERKADWERLIGAIPAVGDMTGDLALITDEEGAALVYRDASDDTIIPQISVMDNMTYVENSQGLLVRARNERRFSSMDWRWVELPEPQISQVMIITSIPAPNGSNAVTMIYPVSSMGDLSNADYYVRCPG